MRRGFTLIEVVIAVAIVAGSVVVVLSLLPSLVQQSSDSTGLLVAQRLPDPIEERLRRESIAIGFAALATAIPVMAAPLDEGWSMVGTSDGMKLARPGTGSDAIEEEEQHFLVEIWRFPDPPLSYEAVAVSLPLYLRVSWPYRVPGVSVPTRLAVRNQFTFCATLKR